MVLIRLVLAHLPLHHQVILTLQVLFILEENKLRTQVQQVMILQAVLEALIRQRLQHTLVELRSRNLQAVVYLDILRELRIMVIYYTLFPQNNIL